jgi:hypothetical protein
MEFLNNSCQPVELKELSLFLLMYADDMVIFSDTIKGLDLITDKSLPQIPIFDNLYHKLSLSIVSNAFV